MSTLFTRIVQGEIPAHKVWEDEHHLAFLDINPVQPGHTLVIPKREVDYLFDLPPDEHAALWTAARNVAEGLRRATGCARVCVGVIGFEVPHCHVHLIPTNEIADWPLPSRTPQTDDQLAETAERIRTTLAG